jgi:rhodanese-related sulfurtransferase/predicted metal-dependent enzyme (double-stranded beta helix superfamily)
MDDGMLAERRREIDATVAFARNTIMTHGPGRAALDKVAERLADLARRAALFPGADFPVAPGKATGLYRIAEDPDGGFAMYASVGLPGKAQPPHDHTTWAIIAGVRGAEHNQRYDRLDNGADPAVIRLRPGFEKVLRQGDWINFEADEFHTIEVRGTETALHLHFYGMSLERLPGRVTVDLATGAFQRFMAKPVVFAPRLSATVVKALIDGTGEIALLDVREEGEHADGHPLFAVPLPLSCLELRAPALLPRPDVRIVLLDADDGRADRAAERLTRLGHRDLHVLAGGVAGWVAAGFELFSGINVPSKAFGEVVEHVADTPRVTAEDLKAEIDRGRDMVILDSRPLDEFSNMSIPGGVNVPGAELVHRIKDLAPDPATLVVVNCAGRTRSIIGAQSLRNAGIENPVVALKDGTMGWHLAGLPLARGETRRYGARGAEAARWSVAAAERLRRRMGLSVIDDTEARRMLAASDRTTHLFDVRDPTEFAQGHRPDARTAPGGQLVQATDGYVAVRGARLILACDDMVRSTMTASWLVQLGWRDVHILRDALAGPLVAGAEPLCDPADPAAATVTPAELAAADAETLVLDLDSSLTYCRAHVRGAWWAMRARLAQALPALPGFARLVLTSADGRLARLAVPEAAELTGKPVAALAGGTAAWIAADLPTDAGEVRMADQPIDRWYRPYDRDTGVEDRMRAYLAWEVALTDQIARDGSARFNVLTG